MFSMQMKTENGHVVRIEDGNWVVKDMLVARKQIFYDGSPVQLWDIEAKLMDAETFSEKAAALGCPVF